MSTAPQSPNEDVQRWSAKRKASIVPDIIKGKTTPVEVARQHGFTVVAVERRRDDFILQGPEVLLCHPPDRAAQFKAREQRLLAKVDELTLAVAIPKEALRILGKDLSEGIS